MDTVNAHGPIFDGHAEREAGDACRDIQQQLAKQGAEMVLQNLAEVIRHPTGYYESHVDASSDGPGWEVTDRGVVYGPWLEGTGSRNRTTRFKGYATFRRTAQELARRAEGIASQVAKPFVRRMG